MSSKNSASVLSPTPRWFSNSCAILDNKDMRTSALVSSALCPAMIRMGRRGREWRRVTDGNDDAHVKKERRREKERPKGGLGLGLAVGFVLISGFFGFRDNKPPKTESLNQPPKQSPSTNPQTDPQIGKDPPPPPPPFPPAASPFFPLACLVGLSKPALAKRLAPSAPACLSRTLWDPRRRPIPLPSSFSRWSVCVCVCVFACFIVIRHGLTVTCVSSWFG